ncbi:hypothetical protein, partial [Paracoccus rhizosphaerae]
MQIYVALGKALAAMREDSSHRGSLTSPSLADRDLPAQSRLIADPGKLGSSGCCTCVMHSIVV